MTEYATEAGIARVTPDVAVEVATVVANAARAAISARGNFVIAIAGGSLVKMLGAMATLPGIEWQKWTVLWVDERCVPHTDSESNYGGAAKAWLSKVDIPAEQILAIDQAAMEGAGYDNEPAVAEAAAIAYETRLHALDHSVLPRNEAGLPIIDLALLGLGPDGHICSLFPDHPLLTDPSNRWVLPISDSPKPPPARITLSLPVVNAATNVVLVGTGAAKQEPVFRTFSERTCSLPCALARPSAGLPLWILDPDAAGTLPEAISKRTADPQCQLV